MAVLLCIGVSAYRYIGVSACRGGKSRIGVLAYRRFGEKSKEQNFYAPFPMPRYTARPAQSRACRGEPVEGLPRYISPKIAVAFSRRCPACPEPVEGLPRYLHTWAYSSDAAFSWSGHGEKGKGRSSAL